MRTKKILILIGAGGHCKSCIDVIEQEKKYKIIGLIDNKKTTFSKYKIIGSDKDLKKIKVKNALITIGQIKDLLIRERTFKSLEKLNFKFPIIISPLAYVSNDASLGAGSIIMHKSFVNKNVKIGKNCIINTGAIIEHDVVIGDNCHIATGAIVNGGVHIGKNTFIGSGSIIKQNLKIGNKCFVNANKFLNKNLKDSSKFV